MQPNKSNRFQDQPWHIKLWRYRYYILIPYWATRMWLFENFKDPLSFKNCWSIAIGLAQINMEWLYSWEESKQRLNKLMDDRED